MAGKITALCSADGWWAGYINDDGSAYFERLAVFAVSVTRDEDTTDLEKEIHEVGGMSATDMTNFNIATDVSDFAGYFHDTDFTEVGEVLSPKAQRRFNKGGF